MSGTTSGVNQMTTEAAAFNEALFDDLVTQLAVIIGDRPVPSGRSKVKAREVLRHLYTQGHLATGGVDEPMNKP